MGLSLTARLTRGSVADRCIPHVASTLYHTCKGGRGEALGQTKLAFDDLVNQLYAGQNPPGVEEALEPEHRAHPGLDAPVVLFDDVVQIRASADLNGGLPTVIEFVVHAMRRRAAWVGSKPSQGNHPRVAVATERLTEEGFGGGDVAGEGRTQPFCLVCRRPGKGKPNWPRTLR